MKSHSDALRRAGIEPRHTGPGTQRLACPECARVKHRPRDTALALTIEADAAVWLCHRCGFKGGTRDEWANDYAAERARSFFNAREQAQVARADAKLNTKLSRAETVAKLARDIWTSARLAPASHPYLVAKRIDPGTLRFTDCLHYSATSTLAGALLVPLRDRSAAVVNLQGIDAHGEKRFLAGGTTRGVFACVGPWVRSVEPEAIAIGEGYATVAAFVRDRSAYRGIAAMSAGNLLSVAEILRERFARAEIVILADQDPVGMLAAASASEAIGAALYLPGLRHRGVTDFADLPA